MEDRLLRALDWHCDYSSDVVDLISG